MDFDTLMKRTRESRNHQRRVRVWRIQHRVLNAYPQPIRPFINFVFSFWTGLIENGPRDMLKPRWGALTFGYLNDGMKPTVWHTVYSITHDNLAPYSGIYPSGAPKSLADAKGKA
jgi:hypothetical protein